MEYGAFWKIGFWERTWERNERSKWTNGRTEVHIDGVLAVGLHPGQAMEAYMACFAPAIEAKQQ